MSLTQSELKGLFSSATNEWATPQEFYNKINKIYNFTLDPCCTKETAKCDMYYTHKMTDCQNRGRVIQYL